MSVPLPRLVLLALLAPLAACGSDDGSGDAADRQAVTLTAQQTARVDRGRRGVRRLRPHRDRPAARRHRALRGGVQERRRRQGALALRPDPDALGGDRAGRRDVRRPRPPHRRPGGRPRRGRRVGRLAPDREGPVAGRGRGGLPSRSATPSGPSTPTGCSTDLSTLKGEVADADYTGEQIANGAKELLDEVANGKVTGEEEFWSHTDLYDFQANVDGAKKSFDVLTPVVERDRPRARNDADHPVRGAADAARPAPRRRRVRAPTPT